jgi:hypothetical protein
VDQTLFRTDLFQKQKQRNCTPCLLILAFEKQTFSLTSSAPVVTFPVAIEYSQCSTLVRIHSSLYDNVLHFAFAACSWWGQKSEMEVANHLLSSSH